MPFRGKLLPLHVMYYPNTWSGKIFDDVAAFYIVSTDTKMSWLASFDLEKRVLKLWPTCVLLLMLNCPEKQINETCPWTLFSSEHFCHGAGGDMVWWFLLKCDCCVSDHQPRRHQRSGHFSHLELQSLFLYMNINHLFSYLPRTDNKCYLECLNSELLVKKNNSGAKYIKTSEMLNTLLVGLIS